MSLDEVVGTVASSMLVVDMLVKRQQARAERITIDATRTRGADGMGRRMLPSRCQHWARTPSAYSGNRTSSSAASTRRASAWAGDRWRVVPRLRLSAASTTWLIAVQQASAYERWAVAASSPARAV